MSRLNIITPCSRPENAFKLFDSILPGHAWFDIRWLIVYDSHRIEYTFPASWIETYSYKSTDSVSGNGQRNFALDRIEHGLVFVLDDDNLIHPDFFCRMAYYHSGYPAKSGFIFSQQLKERTRVARPEDVRVTHIDQAQFVLDYGLIQDKRYLQDYCADGHFIEAIYKANKNEFLFIPEVLSYYNKLRW